MISAFSSAAYKLGTSPVLSIMLMSSMKLSSLIWLSENKNAVWRLSPPAFNSSCTHTYTHTHQANDSVARNLSICANCKNALHKFEIACVQFINFWPRADPNFNPNPNHKPNGGPDPSPNLTAILTLSKLHSAFCMLCSLTKCAPATTLLQNRPRLYLQSAFTTAVYWVPPSPPLDNIQTYGDCLEVKREYYQNSSVLDCVTQCSQSTAYLCKQFLQVK